MVTVPSQGDEFSKLIHHIGEAQNCSAKLMHLAQANDDKNLAMGWFAIQELFKRLGSRVTDLAMRKMQ